jgi:hypothetical protein
MMDQRELEIKSLRSEIEKLKRREQTWSLELHDAAAVTSTLTERMELLEMALADKEESLQKTEVCPHSWLGLAAAHGQSRNVLICVAILHGCLACVCEAHARFKS